MDKKNDSNTNPTVIKELLVKANTDNAEAAYAQAELGEHYFEGELVKQDFEKALKWFKMAAENGNIWEGSRGLYRLYNEFKENSFENKVLTSYFEDVAQGNFDEQFRIAESYYYGKNGMNVDKIKAINWYEKAAQNGSPDAMYFLGKLYRYGIDVKKNVSKTIDYYTYLSDPNDGLGWAGPDGEEDICLQLIEIYWNGEDDGNKYFERVNYLGFWGRNECGDKLVAETYDFICMYGTKECVGTISFKNGKFHWNLVHDATFENKLKHLSDFYDLKGGSGADYSDAIIIKARHNGKKWNIEQLEDNIVIILYPRFYDVTIKVIHEEIDGKLYDICTMIEKDVTTQMFFDVTFVKEYLNKALIYEKIVRTI